MSGHLRRRAPGNSGKGKRHWFVLKDHVLYTYKASEDTVAVETLPVLGWSLRDLSQVKDALARTSGLWLGYLRNLSDDPSRPWLVLRRPFYPILVLSPFGCLH